ncbi:hypothetical protein B0H11DRAFT_2050567 [Mycena galericulata]|nr:hypothetical protein B0H11DRAFT_2050567 [Mycena galericulata]
MSMEPLSSSSVIADFLQTIDDMARRDPRIGEGLLLLRTDLERQLLFLAHFVGSRHVEDFSTESLVAMAGSSYATNPRSISESGTLMFDHVVQAQAPPIISAEASGDFESTADSISVAAATSLPDAPDDFPPQSFDDFLLQERLPSFDEVDTPNDADSKFDSLAVAAPTSSPAATATQNWTDDPGLSNFLLDAGDESMSFDLSILGLARNLHEFFLAPHILPPISSIEGKRIPGRKARPVEILDLNCRLREVVYLHDMSSRVYDFLRGIAGEDLKKVTLNSEHSQCLSAGPLVTNCSKQVWSEADVEFHFRATQAHFVAEAMNIMEGFPLDKQDRYYPRKGTPGSRPGQSFHAFADVEIGRGVVEMKTVSSINELFIQNFLDIPSQALQKLILKHGTNAGYKFDFSPPAYPLLDTVGQYVQPVVQGWAQLYEKKFQFGQGSSQEHSFFVIKDPETPKRLYISPCLPTFPAGDDPASATPSESGLYTMFNIFRIANRPEYAEQFLRQLRESMENKIVAVQYRNPEWVGTPPESNSRRTVNLTKGTVGVLYYDQPVTKQGVIRNPKGPKPTYKDLTTSRIEESGQLYIPPGHGSKTPVVQAGIGSGHNEPGAELAIQDIAVANKHTKARVARSAIGNAQPPSQPTEARQVPPGAGRGRPPAAGFGSGPTTRSKVAARPAWQ